MEEDGCAEAEPNTSCGSRWRIRLGTGHSGLITKAKFRLGAGGEESAGQGYWETAVLGKPSCLPRALRLSPPGTAISWAQPPMMSTPRHVKVLCQGCCSALVGSHPASAVGVQSPAHAQPDCAQLRVWELNPHPCTAQPGHVQPRACEPNHAQPWANTVSYRKPQQTSLIPCSPVWIPHTMHSPFQPCPAEQSHAQLL